MVEEVSLQLRTIFKHLAVFFISTFYNPKLRLGRRHAVFANAGLSYFFYLNSN